MKDDDQEPRSADGNPLDDDELRSMPTEENARIGEGGQGGWYTCTSEDGLTVLCDNPRPGGETCHSGFTFKCDDTGPTCTSGWTVLCDGGPGPTCTTGWTLKCDK